MGVAVSTARARVSIRDAGGSGGRILVSPPGCRKLSRNQQKFLNTAPGECVKPLEKFRRIIGSLVITGQPASATRISASPKRPFTNDPWAPPSEYGRV